MDITRRFLPKQELVLTNKLFLRNSGLSSNRFFITLVPPMIWRNLCRRILRNSKLSHVMVEKRSSNESEKRYDHPTMDTTPPLRLASDYGTSRPVVSREQSQDKRRLELRLKPTALARRSSSHLIFSKSKAHEQNTASWTLRTRTSSYLRLL